MSSLPTTKRTAAYNRNAERAIGDVVRRGR